MSRHSKAMAVLLSFVAVCLLIVVIGAYKLSETAFFCGVCHNMKVYVESWKTSKHHNVACIECHYKPGFVNHLKGKWRDGQLSLAYFITGKRPTKPHAEIDDASCLQSGCHKKENLRREIVFKNVVFNHSKHLDRMKRQKQLRCTTCHSQIVQGAHITVTDVECFICHFYKTKGQKEYVTGCTSCHFEAKGDIKISASFDFNHKLYMTRRIKCDTCHRNVITGDGRIQENSCLKCHNKREVLEAKYTPEFMHRNHVTDHKVECFECHSAIKHKIVPLRYTSQEAGVCSACHESEVHIHKVRMYVGKGAKFVDDHPNRMALINMDCDVCHQPGLGKAALEQKCKECHSNLTDGMVERWKKILKEKRDELQKELMETKTLTGKKDGKEWKNLLDAASYNYEYLFKGDGVHNIIYAVNILEATKNKLRETRSRTQGMPFKPSPSKLSCTYMCHGDILQKSIPFGTVRFLHEIHAEGDDSCMKCHSSYSNHGKIILKGCSECHHGEGAGKVTCKDCHQPVERMVGSEGAIHRNIACTSCHAAIKTARKTDPAGIKDSCVKCHDKNYPAILDNWLLEGKKVITGFDTETATLEKELSSIESKEGRHSVPLRKIYDNISEDIKFLRTGKIVHNPKLGHVVISRIENNIIALKQMIKDKQQGRSIVLK